MDYLYLMECEYCKRELPYPDKIEITEKGVTRCKDGMSCDETWMRDNPEEAGD